MQQVKELEVYEIIPHIYNCPYCGWIGEELNYIGRDIFPKTYVSHPLYGKGLCPTCNGNLAGFPSNPKPKRDIRRLKVIQ